MGSTVAMGYAELVANGTVKLEQAIRGHLLGNFYPPHPECMVPVAVRAINKVNNGETSKVRLPEGVEHNRYGKLVPPEVVVEALRLEYFINREDEEEW